MLEIQTWMRGYIAAVRSAFGDRVRYIGLQGSRARGEAGPDSDIDVVCILDECSLADLETYRAAVEHLPARDKLCGFVSGAAELAAWDRGDLFSFRHDTADWYGQLTDLLPPERAGGRPPGPPHGGLRPVPPVLPQLPPRQKYGGCGGGLQVRCVPSAGPRRTWSRASTAAAGRTWHSIWPGRTWTSCRPPRP